MFTKCIEILKIIMHYTLVLLHSFCFFDIIFGEENFYLTPVPSDFMNAFCTVFYKGRTFIWLQFFCKTFLFGIRAKDFHSIIFGIMKTVYCNDARNRNLYRSGMVRFFSVSSTFWSSQFLASKQSSINLLLQWKAIFYSYQAIQ